MGRANISRVSEIARMRKKKWQNICHSYIVQCTHLFEYSLIVIFALDEHTVRCSCAVHANARTACQCLSVANTQIWSKDTTNVNILAKNLLA